MMRLPGSSTLVVSETAMGRPSVVKFAHGCVDGTPLLSAMLETARTGRIESACEDEATMLVCGALTLSVGHAAPAAPVVVFSQTVTVTVMGGGSCIAAVSTVKAMPLCTGTPAAAAVMRTGATPGDEIER